MFEELKELLNDYSDTSGTCEEIEENIDSMNGALRVLREFDAKIKVLTPPYPRGEAESETWSAINMEVDRFVEKFHSEMAKIIKEADRDEDQLFRALEDGRAEERNEARSERQLRSCYGPDV